jgi:uncharacterized protein YbaP (TraB family)
MKKLLLLVFTFSILLSSGAQAQLLWKISGHGLAKPSYLFGTHHLIEKEQIKNFDQIMSLCSQADATVGEVDMSDKDLQAKMMQAITLSNGTIKDLLSAEDYDFVDKEFKQLMGVGLEQLGKMKPMMLDNLFGIMSCLKNSGLEKQPESMDILFQKKATELNKKVLSLETIEEQLTVLFGTLSLQRQAELLVKDIREKQKGMDLLKNLTEVYLAGDLDKMDALNKEDNSMTPEEKKLLAESRNLNWMKKIPALMNDQSCFIAVGCLHLVGETGLIQQLRQAGYTVESVSL